MERARRWRWAMAIASGLVLLGPAYAIASAAGLVELAAAIVALVVCAAAAVLVERHAPARLAVLLARRPVVGALWVVAVLAGAGNMARVSVYMADASQVSWAVWPGDFFYEKHNCFTAYYRAGTLSREHAANVYDEVHYWGADASAPRAARPSIDGFSIDLYEYPPPFLVPVRAALVVTPDFLTLRALWFGVEALLFLAGVLLLAAWIGGDEGAVVALASPLAVFALPVLVTLQIGNYQLAAFAITIAALVAFEARWTATGALLLASATLTKMFPGLFLVYLAARRQWRALAYTVVAMVVVLAVTLIVVGAAPFEAFVHYQLPRMASGAAFPMLNRVALAENQSVFGIVIKLRALGIPGMTFGVAGIVAWIYTAILLVVTVVVARRDTGRLPRAIMWVALLELAALRSPFSPQTYAVVGPLWLLALSVPSARGRHALAIAIGVAWVALNVIVMLTSNSAPISMHVRLVVCGIAQAIGIAITVLALRRSAVTP